MSVNLNQPLHINQPNFPATQPGGAAAQAGQAPQNGAGPLQHQQIAVGNGQLAGLRAPLLPRQPAPNAQVFGQITQQQLVDLRSPVPGGLSSKPNVLLRLEQHAQNQGTPLSRQELRALVAAGEKICTAIANGPPGQNGQPTLTAPGQVQLQDRNGQTITLNSNSFTTRAVAWYMMAAAANHDEIRAQAGLAGGASDMVTNGSMLMKDPGNRLYDFLRAAPLCASRTSTHVNERVDHTDRHWMGGPKQRGIEDFNNLLPGAGGTLLFDKTRGANGGQELFVKFEPVGCPSPFKREPQESGFRNAIGRFFSAIGRNLGHALNFLNTRGHVAAGAAAVVRQEHVYKGVLKPIADQFDRMIDAARTAGLITKAEVKQWQKDMKDYGLPKMQMHLDRLQVDLEARPNPAVQAQADLLHNLMQDEMGRLGLISNVHGIERRGAEVHISYNPADQP